MQPLFELIITLKLLKVNTFKLLNTKEHPLKGLKELTYTIRKMLSL